MNAVGQGSRYIIVPELLFAAAAQDGVTEVRIDLVARTLTPETLFTADMQRSVALYAEMLFRLCRDQNVDEAAVRSAEIVLAFDYSRTRRTKHEPIREIQEFECTVSIGDDRGVTHRANPNHWWMV